MRKIISQSLAAAGFFALVMLRCANLTNLSGAGSETTNSLAGTVAKADGFPASGAIVRCVPDTFDAVKNKPLPASFTDTADEQGWYQFDHVGAGTYTVQVKSSADGARAAVFGIPVKKDTVQVPAVTLLAPGVIKIMLPSGIDKTAGYVYLPGTTIFKFLKNSGDFVLLDSVAPGIVPILSLSATNSSASSVIRYDIPVVSGDTVVVARPSWKYARRFFLITTPLGAGVIGTVTKFPVLIRLNANNFDFSQAKAGGADLRFAKSDDSDLPYEVERWDPAANEAEIWVLADTILGNNDRQYLVMYWGNPEATSASSSQSVFDTATGFQGVWHLNEYGDNVALDGTANRYNGNASNMANLSPVPGQIGSARAFNGVSSCLVMPNTANSRLNFPQGGYYTVSAWVLVDSLDYASHVIVSKGYEQYYLRMTSLRSNSPLWEFVEFNETTKWETSTFPATGKQWMLLTGVRQGGRQLLYCNGVLVDSTIEAWPNAVSRNTSNDLSIGRFLQPVNVPIPGEGYDFFKGSIDEVRILNTAQSRDWIRLCYMNQRSDDRLVQFK